MIFYSPLQLPQGNITRLKAVYHCVAIELAVRRIELKKALAIASAFFWCERRDLNPYGITTRPSNVRVCRFRHSRIFSSPFLTTNDIISKSRGSVNTFLENILLFSEKNYIVDFRHVDIKAFCRAFRYINRKCNVRFNRNIGNLCAFKYFVGILCGGVA